MKITKLECTCFLILGLACLLAGQSQKAQSSTSNAKKKPLPLKLVQTIPLPKVEGRFDHISIDVKGKRLFVAALGYGTVEVIDLAAGKPVHTINGLKDPQGVLYVPETNLLFVDDGELGACLVYDGSSYQLVRTESEMADADNIRLNGPEARIYGAAPVMVSWGSRSGGGLRMLDSRTGKPLSEIPLEGKSESFQIDPVSGRIFINMPTQGYIAVASSSKRRVVEKWPVEGFKSFFPMALDVSSVGGRDPSALSVP